MPLSPPDMLCFALHSAAHAMHSAYQPLLHSHGLTYPQYLVLLALSARDDQTVGELCAELRLETNTVTPLLKRMQAAGWVTRQRAPQDERQVRVSLTPDGQALARSCAGIPRVFAEKTGLDLSEITDLRDILTALRDRLKPAGG